MDYDMEVMKIDAKEIADKILEQYPNINPTEAPTIVLGLAIAISKILRENKPPDSIHDDIVTSLYIFIEHGWRL